MLLAQLFQKIGGRAGVPGLHIFIRFAHAIHSFAVVLPLPFQIIGEHFIQRGGGVLPVPLAVIVQLGLTFRRKMHLHAPKVGFFMSCVNEHASDMIAVDPA